MSLKDKLFRLLLLIIAIQWSAGAELVVAQQSPFDRLISRFDEGQIFRAEFNHIYADSYTGDTTETSGTLWVGEGQYKVQNEQQTVVVDGETSRVYDRSRNRVIVSNYEPEEDDFAPSRFLNGADSTYTVANQQQSGSQTVITLTSTDPFSIFNRVEITLTNNLIPTEIFALDQADNTSTTTFFSGLFVEEEEDLFVLNYPTEAEIVDMRN